MWRALEPCGLQRLSGSRSATGWLERAGPGSAHETETLFPVEGLSSSAAATNSSGGSSMKGLVACRARRAHGDSPHVKEPWMRRSVHQGFQELELCGSLGRTEFSTAFPLLGSVTASDAPGGGLTAPRSPAGGARNIVSEASESKRKSAPCALLSHYVDLLEDFRVQSACAEVA